MSFATVFVDLATLDELEKYLYGIEEALTYFVAQHRKSTWFSLCPIMLSKTVGQADWGQEWGVNVSRSGDYLVHTWLRVVVPKVTLAATGAAGVTGVNNDKVRWTHNFGHNLIKTAAVTFNDLSSHAFDSHFLDFWAAYTVPSSKQLGYDNMIGNTSDLTKDGALRGAAAAEIPSFVINVPLPFWFTRDTGVSLPTAALPYNEIRIVLTMRDWTDLLVFYPNTTGAAVAGVGGTDGIGRAVISTDGVTVGKLTEAQIWAEYAVVSSAERKSMGCKPRDMIIEQTQTVPKRTLTTGISNPIDIRLSHAVKVLFFGARNKTVPCEWSNYTMAGVLHNGVPRSTTDVDPVKTASLLYEGSTRLNAMPADYFALMEPFYKAVTIPQTTGYHMYSYSLAIKDIDPKGSTNYGKLTNTTLSMELNAPKTGAGSETIIQEFESVILASNHNVCRISGGAYGHPVC